ncbi:RNA polymerase sigma factor [Sulfidibacter corallicola]|uniref:RNA polymerase sigma factor n=1 Tax=Sulfidibacter corallicola TaxID=2818388 RepID=A0A8A4TD64_SULCO|nr:RNA polymerase sigma factor [Sulfidibacter corallicola]QTD48029.1 RNA polymerase sigma factor [Sulfidibacter corallicola]
MRHLSDRYLVKRILAGDEQAFQAYYEEYFPKLYRFVLPRAPDDWVADILQQTMVLAVRKLHTYRGEAALFTWLCTIARNEIAGHYRRQGREMVPLQEDHPEIQAALASLAADAESPEGTVHRRDIERRIWIALDNLPSQYAAALRMKYLEDMSMRDIARSMETTVKAVESMLTRARAAFRDGFIAVSGGQHD